MQKKQMLFKTKGMNQDLSVSAFNPEFSFENMNLRLSTNEHNTLLSWVNERGTEEVDTISIDVYPWMTDAEWEDYEELHPGASRTVNAISGTPIGSTVINHQLVVFTSDTGNEEHTDRIYVLTYNKENNSIAGSCLFAGNLNFDYQHPVECLVSYEAEEIQKVYWVDGLNQPRIINIKASKDKIKTWNESTELATFFDFNPAITLSGNINVQRNNTTGTFAPGVIQYAFCYLNMYSQQSNIVDISPLYYISPSDRGASPEERVTCSFDITISSAQVDTNYNYVRLFSIQRTSIDSTPIVKHLIDISLNEAAGGNNIYYKDTGTNGEIMDSTALLFMSKRPMSAETIADKDNTLFLGNITDLTASTGNIQNYFNSIREGEDKINLTFYNSNEKIINLEDSEGTIYKNTFELKESQQKISTFKGGEEYRFGFQLKDKYGVWSNPIFIDDYTNDCYPQIEKLGNLYNCKLVLASAVINIYKINEYLEEDIREKYVEIRPVIVHPTEADRKVLCQGVLNPTVFQASARYNQVTIGAEAQSSWFFRPMTSMSEDANEYGKFVTFKHFDNLPPMWLTKNPYTTTKKVEIYGTENIFNSAYDTSAPSVTTVSNNTTQFLVDQSVVTLNSPDIELAESELSYIPEDTKLRIVGAVPITANASYTYIESSAKGTEITTEITPNYTHNNISQYGGQRLISDFLWQDSLFQNIDYSVSEHSPHAYYERFSPSAQGIQLDTESTWKPNSRKTKFMINPWHASGPLNNDWEWGSTKLVKKVEVTQLFSHFSDYFNAKSLFKEYSNINVGLYSAINKNTLLLPSQSIGIFEKSYAGFVDTAVLNNGYIKPAIDTTMQDLDSPNEFDFNTIEELQTGVAQNVWGYMGSRANNIVSMKYNSASHAVITFKVDSNQEIPILPQFAYNGMYINRYIPSSDYDPSNPITFWGESMKFRQDIVNYSTVQQVPLFRNYAFLWLAELYRDETNGFGGDTVAALKANNWLIGGESKTISANTLNVNLKWTNGDTFFQRYDCLKTYPLTDEDTNQNSEILSFMCETRINLDGRYDKLRGVSRDILPLIDSTNINKINPIYSQKDNYFTSKVFQQEDITSHHYPNYICYSMTKEPGSDVDTYTDISLASVLELDGDKGEISALRKLNNHIFAFQDSGISRVMFNDNVQVQSTEGVPIQIANSGKVLGKDYISNTVGCSNKWSIVQTPNGLYFMDSNDKSIYLFNGQLDNISAKNGFNTWCKQYIPASNAKWNPVDFNNFVGHYDRQNQEVLYVNKETSLAWSEKLGAFTSFYDYGNSPFFENLDDVGLWIKGNGSLWRHQAGDYGKFFGVNKPYWMTLVGNPESQIDKLFTNLEFRACVDGEGINSETGKFTPALPFNSLETWNEYQHGKTTLENKNGMGLFNHGGDSSALIRKFRIWRCDIPRDNFQFMTYPVKEEEETEEEYQERVTAYNEWLQGEQSKGIYRVSRHVNDRMRNPWLYLKLFHQEAATDETLDRAEIHDIVMDYFE